MLFLKYRGETFDILFGSESCMNITERETWKIWIAADEKIASFHHIEGYQRAQFMNHEFFLSKVQSLIDAGFKFQ